MRVVDTRAKAENESVIPETWITEVEHFDADATYYQNGMRLATLNGYLVFLTTDDLKKIIGTDNCFKQIKRAIIKNLPGEELEASDPMPA